MPLSGWLDRGWRDHDTGPKHMRRLAWLGIVLVLVLVPLALVGFGARVFGARAVAPAAVAAVAPAAPDEPSTVYFAAGTTQIRPRDMGVLDAHAVWLHGERKRVLVIEGHTDGPGDSALSLEIGEQRARSAKAYLVTKGVIADRIMTESRGGGQPTCQDKTPTCRALNRRVTVSRTVLP
jgi:outer membrane protein OmpA-like peptidoglycan-associated protein